ncbi:MAG: ribosomal-protein-alanine N-acetyltransferase [Comamonadaceae bacterium]|nr:MAG: ribosomal-protein-alanine N-acetyltransferase [Comamonadaceae bacterium]
MSAMLQPLEAGLEPLTSAHLDAVLAIEQAAYSHPWSRANFIDSLAAGYHGRALVGPLREGGQVLIGYYVAMLGVEEVHLLNITVAPEFQRQGWAPLMLEALAGWSRAQRAQWLWLEVRASNERAMAVYQRHGFRRVGLRKGYYPGVDTPREDAIVMNLRLDERGSAWGGLTA